MNVNICKINPIAKIPEYKTDGSAGADLYSCDDVYIAPHETKLVHLGFKTEFRPNYVALIYPRSGLATKQGLAPANKVGVIDSDYRGEWMVALYNHSNEAQSVKAGDRIAQVVFQEVNRAIFYELDNLKDSERGEGGFGSTGN